MTGHLSSNDPNLQNIPIRTPEGRRIREAFIATQGTSSSAPTTASRARIIAHLSNDAALLAAFTEGLDVRTTAAESVWR